MIQGGPKEITIPGWDTTTRAPFLHLLTVTTSTTAGPLFINMADNKALAWQLHRGRQCNQAV